MTTLRPFLHLLSSHGTLPTLSCTDTPEQNGPLFLFTADGPTSAHSFAFLWLQETTPVSFLDYETV